jgi:hypothetical protein
MRINECSRRLLHSFATNLRRLENPPWRSASGETSKCSVELVEEQGSFRDKAARFFWEISIGVGSVRKVGPECAWRSEEVS